MSNGYTSVFNSLNDKTFFKLVCGASFEDVLIVENLAFLFSLVGADVLDVAPKADVIFAARRGIEKANKIEIKEQSSERRTPIIMASIQLDSDPHFRKAVVDFNSCDVCGACINVCPTEAFSKLSSPISELLYKPERCFGCGFCPEVCHVDALSMKEVKQDPSEIIDELLKLGISSVEFHFGKNYKRLNTVWHQIKNKISFFKLISFSIGWENADQEEIIHAAKLCRSLAGKNIIIQCDGKSMSGGQNKYSQNDMDAIEIAKIIDRENLGVYLQLAGGIHEGTAAKIRGFNIHGLAVGSRAKKMLLPYLNLPDLDLNPIAMQEALTITKSFVAPIKSDLFVV